MKESFPNLLKEINFQEVQEAQRVPKKLDPMRNTPRHIIIKLPKNKDKEKILKTARGALASVAQWTEHRLVNKKVASSIPSQCTCLGCRPDPQERAHRGNHTLMFLALTFSLTFPLSKYKK